MHEISTPNEADEVGLPLPRGLARRRPFRRVALARCRGLFRGARARRRGPARGRLAADAAATFRRDVGVGDAAAGAALVAAAGFLVDRRPGPPLGFLSGRAARLITLLDMFGHSLLL